MIEYVSEIRCDRHPGADRQAEAAGEPDCHHHAQALGGAQGEGEDLLKFDDRVFWTLRYCRGGSEHHSTGANPLFSVRLFGADTLWEEGAHPCSCR